MKLSKFKFNLPQELIALHPAKNRDESRLMVVNRKTGEIEHKVFKDLLDYFGKKMCLSSITQKSFRHACMEIKKRLVPVSRFSCCVS